MKVDFVVFRYSTLRFEVSIDVEVDELLELLAEVRFDID